MSNSIIEVDETCIIEVDEKVIDNIAESRGAQTIALQAWLIEQYPATFSLDKPPPLKIGIHVDLLTRHPDLDPAILKPKGTKPPAPATPAPTPAPTPPPPPEQPELPQTAVSGRPVLRLKRPAGPVVSAAVARRAKP